MEKLTEEEIKSLSNFELIKRMDEIINSSFLSDNFRIMRINISAMMETEKIKSFNGEFQRKIAYKIFGMILQIIYTHLSVQPNFNHFPKGDRGINKQFSWAESEQWMGISSRIIAEYFMSLLYMIGTGKELRGRSKFNKIKSWLKQPDNEFVYFAISVARAKKYSRIKRENEIHANTKLAKKVLTLSAHEIDNSIFDLLNIIQTQLQYLLLLSNNKEPTGYSLINDEYNDKNWYEIVIKSKQEIIDLEIDEMMPD